VEVLILTTFVSIFLAAGGVGLFVWSVRARTFDQNDRLALLPLDDSEERTSSATDAPPSSSQQHPIRNPSS
jgi:cbb3-type cytochrome oxidase maturation protein